jgi:hypothetical protein
VVFPLISDGEVVGTMDFFTTARVEFDPERLAFWRSVGRFVSSSVQRFAVAERSAQAAADAQAVNRVIDQLGKANTVDALLRLALDAVKDTTRTCAPTRRSPRRTAAPAARPAAQPEEVDPRVAVCADVGGYRVQGRFDTTTGALEITRGPMEGRRFPDPTTAADAVAGFLSGDIESHDGDTFWRLDGPKAPALGEYLARSS